MRKKVLSIVLVAALAVSMLGCSASSSKESETKEPAKKEETAKTEEKEEEQEESQELNKYGITDAQLEAFVSTMKERIQKEFFDVYGIDPAGFEWAEGPWLDNRDVIAMLWMNSYAGIPADTVVESMEDNYKNVSRYDPSVDSFPSVSGELLALVDVIFATWVSEENIDLELFDEAIGELYGEEAWSGFVRETVSFN